MPESDFAPGDEVWFYEETRGRKVRTRWRPASVLTVDGDAVTVWIEATDQIVETDAAHLSGRKVTP